jgi:hypothetical protein
MPLAGTTTDENAEKDYSVPPSAPAGHVLSQSKGMSWASPKESAEADGGYGGCPPSSFLFGVGAEQRRAMRSKRGERQERIISEEAVEPKQSHEAAFALLVRLLQAPPSQRQKETVRRQGS